MFIPNKSAWQKMARVLKGIMDADRFEALTGTESLPLPAGDHQCMTVKVIDPRGNEAMRVHSLRGAAMARDPQQAEIPIQPWQFCFSGTQISERQGRMNTH